MESCTYFLPNSTVKISGMDLNDCFDTFEKRRAEFSKTIYDIDMYTPKLAEYYKQRREQKSA